MADTLRRQLPFTVLEDTVLLDPELTQEALLVYWSLCHHADKAGERCFPSLTTLCRESRCGRASVLKAIELLMQHRYILKEPRFNPKRPAQRLSNLYTIVLRGGSSQENRGSSPGYRGGSSQEVRYPDPSFYPDPHNQPAAGADSAPTASRDAEYLPLAEDLAAAVIKTFPRQRCNPAGWTRDIRLLIEADHATVEEVRRVVAWLPTAPTNGTFSWAKNILSGAKLRKHFARLLPEAGRNGDGQAAGDSAEQAAAALFGRI